jgi:putative hemolysin
MSKMLMEVVLILVLLACNGLLAMAEIALVSARRSRLERLAAGGNRRAAAAVGLLARPTRFLSTVQIGITLVGILAGAFGGATVARELAAMLATVPALAPYSSNLAFALVVAVITYLSLVIGELVPKRIALASPERITLLVARPMALLARVSHPVVHVLEGSTDLVVRLLGLHRAQATPVTDEDVRALIAQGTASGNIAAAEEEIVERVLRLGDRPASAVMTPRIDVEWVEPGEEPESLRQVLREGRHAWLLVCEQQVDNVLGVVSTAALLRQCVMGQPFDVRGALQPPLFVPESTPLLTLLEQFRGTRASIAILLDEFGGVQGVVTLSDILDDLMGDLSGVPMPAPGEAQIVERPDGGWLVDGAAPIEELAETLVVPLTEAAHPHDYRTLAGLVLTRLGHLPRVGESVEAYGLRFEVIDMDGRRIDRVLVTRLPPEVEQP